jgi:hypothetical protein
MRNSERDLDSYACGQSGPTVGFGLAAGDDEEDELFNTIKAPIGAHQVPELLKRTRVLDGLSQRRGVKHLLEQLDQRGSRRMLLAWT